MAGGSAGPVAAVHWDLDGVLLQMDWDAAARHWEPGLGLPRGGLLRAVFGGSDGTVLVGRVSEEAWWELRMSALTCAADSTSTGS